MGIYPLAQNLYAKSAGEIRIREAGRELSRLEQNEILEKTARDIAVAGLALLGEDFSLGVIDDPERGKIIDVVKRQLSGPDQSAA